MSTKITVDLEYILATIKDSSKKVRDNLRYYRWDTFGANVTDLEKVDLKTYYATLINEYEYLNKVYMSLFSSECSFIRFQEDENIREFWKALGELNDEIDTFIETVRERLEENPSPTLKLM